MYIFVYIEDTGEKFRKRNLRRCERKMIKNKAYYKENLHRIWSLLKPLFDTGQSKYVATRKTTEERKKELTERKRK